MTGKIAFHDLIVRASRGALSPGDIQSFFKLDALKSKPFDPHFRVNYDAVDVTGFEQTAAIAGDALAVEAARRVAPAGAVEAAPVPNGTFVAEGDSWFRLPPIVYPPTMMDVLSGTYPINNLAHWGDTLAGMLAARQYLPFLRSGKLKVLLFSAGGNDLLGETLGASMKFFSVDHQQPSDAAWYLTETFFSQLKSVMAGIAMLIEQVRSVSPTTRLIMHGYDYARPQENGIFLGVQFQSRGLHPLDRPALCQAIVKVMVDQFNSRLAALAAHYNFFRYVDLRGTVGPDDWYDSELHPNAAAAARLAQRMRRAMPPPADAPAAVPVA